ncbi:MAG: HAD-IIIC family phosphatase, partial [Candidatus Rokuibacteriota bacterium]
RERLAQVAPRPPAPRTVRLALLGGVTTEILEGPLALAVEAAGLGCEIRRGQYNAFAQEILDPGSPLLTAPLDVAVLLVTPANIPTWPEPGDDLARVHEIVDEVCRYWIDLCARLHERTGCEVVLNNFHPLSTRPLGTAGARLPWDRNNFLRRLNVALGDRLPPYLHLNDVEALASRHGLHRWFDERYWYHAKQPVSFECLVPFVRSVARIVGALFGLTGKCLVVDLDNTLWGGVVGDDGHEGIVIGEGDAVGEAFKAFQEYLLRLKQRGVLLAVASKNEEANALSPFARRPEMVLKREDFVAFKANWEPKPLNLRAIAEELNIGLNSLVFVDDNPVERDQVRQALPEVAVVELTADPADYPRLLDEAGLFEITTVSAEDRQRSRQYEDNVRRDVLRQSVGDYRAYLGTLEQKGVLGSFEERYLDRITQLVNKSNQFNLTTLRLTRSEVEARMQDPDTVAVYVRLADRFGDNGLISVVCGAPDGARLVLDEWLMSCRVLNRGVEQLVCNHLVDRAREWGLATLEGVYRPTAKNALVREHYAGLGFTLVDTAAEGTTRWSLDVERFQRFDVPIQLVKDY